MADEACALIVEDESFTGSMLARVLRGWGYRVRVARNAAAAWEVAAQQLPDVVIADLDLGDGPTGLDVLEVLRRDAPDLPAVILTNHRSPQLVQNNPPQLANAAYLVKADLRSTEQIREALLGVRGVGPMPDPVQPAVPAITKGQAEILRLLADGLSNDQIADRRVTTRRAVELSIQRIYKTLGLADEGANARVRAVEMFRNAGVTVK